MDKKTLAEKVINVEYQVEQIEQPYSNGNAYDTHYRRRVYCTAVQAARERTAARLLHCGESEPFSPSRVTVRALLHDFHIHCSVSLRALQHHFTA